ncbi:hypothetical protein EMPS_03540 [Entomortierella parvispora]|uniref:Uncharacterized protein n=1 Tax=Entomortierella parvispora TaxID=205924 RepID=A0A9P3H6T2_9FUNG|nr:hypothetical protein EMPS_03540 [Entomortierella parvispora]
MTAPTASTSSTASAFGQPHARSLSGGNNNSGSEQHRDADEDDVPKLDQPQGSRSSDQQPQPTDADPHPELDQFVNEFYDGDKFTDVDSRVWV